MDNASANPSPSVLTTPAPTPGAVVPGSTARAEKLYKTVYGRFWHFETDGRRRSSYLLTACGRRLGRWHIEPARPAAAIPTEDICAGCVRKLTH